MLEFFSNPQNEIKNVRKDKIQEHKNIKSKMKNSTGKSRIPSPESKIQKPKFRTNNSEI